MTMFNHLLHKPALYCTMAFLIVLAGVVALADDAENAENAFQRGLKALRQKAWDQAVADFSEAIKLQPNEPKNYGLRGTALLRKGDYDQGLADLKTAIRLNPNDLGTTYQPASNKELSPEALKYGNQQVQKMLEDRPAMAQYGNETAFLRSWAARKFAGEDLGSLIDWEPTPPMHSDAEHLAPEGNLHGSILIEPRYASGPKQGQPRVLRGTLGRRSVRIAQHQLRKTFCPVARGSRPRHGFQA